MREKLGTVSIDACANGWQVRTGGMRDGFDPMRVYVFDTFEKLTKWLKENLRAPDDRG